MIQEIERKKRSTQTPGSDGTWIQITFTLDPEHYHALWQRAEEEHRTLPGLARESVIDHLEEIRNAARQRESSAKQNAGDLL